jgi:outer membrane protein OmpA-like peptidoglycan-associated protein
VGNAAQDALKKDLAMQESGGTIMMNLEGDVLFDFDKSELRPEAKEGLDKVAAVIAAFPESNVLIEGYTDSKGSPKANLTLSKKRAESVKDWLVKQKDISADIMTKVWARRSRLRLTTTPKAGKKTGG